MKTIIVIGGGAAGMMAAYAAAETAKQNMEKSTEAEKIQVLLYEKNEKLGKKIFITGKGRCNVTNACDAEEFFRNVISNEKFMYSSFYHFDNRMAMDFFEKAGCSLKTERGDRVFPVSDHSSDVIAALTRKLKEAGVQVHLNTAAEQLLWEKREQAELFLQKETEQEELRREDSKRTESRQSKKKKEKKNESGKVIGVLLKDGKKVMADAVIVATGGISYPLTGSDGDGYQFAEETGHRLIKPVPALVPLVVKEDWCRSLQGLSLKNVSVTLREGKKELYSGFGEMLFTHFGVSGPLILSASSYYAKQAKEKQAELLIDLKPALSKEQLDKRILRDFEENKNKQFKNAVGGLFPAKLIPVMIELSGIHPDKKVHEISKEERKAFAELIKNLSLTVTGTRDIKEAIVTMGGVNVKDVNPSAMESKRIKNLYFAGEVLDVDALTGGFNLQIAWSTGYLAGNSAAEALQAEKTTGGYE